MSRFSASAPLLNRLRKLATLGDMGITSRLVLALGSVAVLAVAANLIVENGHTIVESIVRHPDSPVAVEAARREREAVVRNELRTSGSQLVLALGDFEKAVRAHVEAGTPASAVNYEVSLGALERAADSFGEKHQANPNFSPAGLQTALTAYRQVSRELVQVSRERRVTIERYGSTVAAMNARLQKSIDGAWKIMGRVVARQSLLKLTAELDVIQSSFATRDVASAGGHGRLVGAEQAFLATFQQNQASLRRSQGAEWVTAMRNDLSKLAASRQKLVQADKQKSLLTQTFAGESARLAQTISGISSLNTYQTAVVVATPTPARPHTDASAPAYSYSTLPAEPHRPALAWISLIVLCVLAYLCIVTIVSVVRPVRRLMVATRQLARGEQVQPLVSGGIRELDALSHAFNSMAHQLAAAQHANLEAQRRLEGKVAERTRELKQLAEKDPLTGLSNRRQLFEALDASIERAREDRRRVGAFFLDIDNFKTLNDSMGHAYGDRVLVAIARRLEVTARAFGFAARLGGDEFMIVHEGAETIDEVAASGDAIIKAFEQPIPVEGREIIVSVSVGVSVFPDHERDAEALMRAADAALFSAKAQGRSRLTLFTPELLVSASAKFAIEQKLRRAIENQEFELFYQPEINVQTLEVSLVEALIRWRMPDGSYQCPGEFLAVAEESGLIIEINDWVLRNAIETAAQWYRGSWPDARVAINVSSRQFLDCRFVDKLRDLLTQFALPTRCLELELTESVLQTGPLTIKALSELRSMGVAIALDDFGTGYSSIASLEQLPLTRVKLDQSLIARMDSSARSASIARATIRLCSELGLEVTAEGVERLEQFAALLGFGAISLQGYLLAEPVCRERIPELIGRVPSHCQELLLSTRALPALPASSPAGLVAVPSARPF